MVTLRLVLLLVLVVLTKASGDIRQVTDGVDSREALTDRDVQTHFELFMTKFGKVYETKEIYAHRLKVFKNNLVQAVTHQLLDPWAVHGITKFSDLTDEEFNSNLIRAVPSSNKTFQAPILPTHDLPESFDWRDYGAVTEVKDQQLFDFCGSCWAFSTTGAVEGAILLKTGKLISLSEQQLIDCDLMEYGCSGGYPMTALEYVMKSGLESEEDYPYTGDQLHTYTPPDIYHGKCNYDPQKVAVSIANFSSISTDEDQIAANLVKHGPLSVAFSTYVIKSYDTGIVCPDACPTESEDLNHAALLVGYGIAGEGSEEMPYWIIKNSFGPDFGEQGYFKMCRNKGMCGINQDVYMATA